MRFLLKLESSSGKPARISLDYRRRFISLLKVILGEDYYSERRVKPFTFAVFFGKEAKIINGEIQNVKRINFRFSSGDLLTIAKFYNGIIKLKKEGYLHPIGTDKFRIESIIQEREREITGIFKTLSPVVVERIGSSLKENPENRYTIPGEKYFEESLLENIYRRYKDILGKEPQLTKFKFIPLNVRREYVRHYGGIIKTFIGKFKIDTDSEDLLKFLYKYGIGLRTGQGFGYLEVEDDIKNREKNF